MSSAIEREGTRLLDGHEIGMLGGYGFQGQVTVGEGSDKKGKIGAGYNNLRWGHVILERTRILGGIQFTTHFIEFFVVGQILIFPAGETRFFSEVAIAAEG